jgi:hypothetical protein
MSVAISNTTFFSSGAISFSALRSAFKEVSEGQISMSELRRNTDTSVTDPVVPDATENSNVSTSGDLRLSSFRNTIKRYDIIQTGTDVNLNGRSQNWNANANRNIQKRLFVRGTVGSSNTGQAALSFDGTGFNYRIIVEGSVLGAGGAGGVSGSPNGKNGGDSMFVRNTNTGTRPFPSGSHRIFLNNGCAVYSGGGGGAKGATGASGTPGTCFIITEYTTGRSCNNCPGCDPGDERLRCFNDGGCNCGKGGCRDSWQRAVCRKTTPYGVPGAPGGEGGNGGQAQGYAQGRQNGFGGAGGTAGGCPTYGGSGATGETGGNGGDWAQSGSGTNLSFGGSPGRAVSGSFYTVEGVINTNTIRGAYT